MKMSAKPLAAIIFVILFGGIAATTVMGWWQTESTKTPARFTEGEAAGEYNPADIRGSYTFGDVNRNFDVPLDDLKIAFGVPDDTDTAAYPLKSLETLYADLPTEIGTASVRMFVAWYKGLPYEPEEETYLLTAAVEILQRQGKLTAEQEAYLAAHTVDLGAPAPAAEATPAPVEATPASAETTPAATEDHEQPDRTITGKTTFQDLLDWGVAPADIEQVLGGSLPPASTVIKDYVTSKGLEFSEAKTALQALVDALP